MRSAIALALAGTALALGACATSGEQRAQSVSSIPAASDPLAEGFANPPQSARPRTWWHWMNGNVTQEGIARDLDWMSRIGLGGVQNFDASLQTPQLVDERLVYMTPEWQDAFRLAVAEADRHGLEFAIAASPGWSETGGPWVQPVDGMKKLSWGETILAGGEHFNGRLNAAPDTTGPYLDTPFADELADVTAGSPHEVPRASGHIAILAVPLLASPLPTPVFALEDGSELAAEPIADASMESSVALPLRDDLSGSVSITYPHVVTVRSAQLFIPGLEMPFRGVPVSASLQVHDGSDWREVAAIPISGIPTTVGFNAVEASEFRLVISDNRGGVGSATIDEPVPGAESFDIFAMGDLSTVPLAAFSLSAEPRLDRVEQKAGFGTLTDYYAAMSRDETPANVDLSQVIDLTDRVADNGMLDWTPPAGSHWRVLSFGWSLTGKTNHPATPEATGLEVDKLDPDAVRRYLETYLGMYRETLGDDMVGARGLQALLTDSIEVGATNWTPQMEAEFEQRRGYALRPWLPALAGQMIGTPAETEAFLFDWRQTLAEMLADNHYGTVAKVAHENGLRVYGEALENGRPMLGNDLEMRQYADVPMAAMWTWLRGSDPRWSLLGDMKGASSVAHVYGQNLVAAESMTSANAPWAYSPRDLKRVIDFEFAHGVNLPVIHTSVHVAVEDRKPGLSLMIFGQHFNRNETWAEMAGPWISYIARNAYMLQQGHYAADIAYFMGEEAPLTAQYAAGVPDGLPTRYGYDYVNVDMLSEALHAEDGQLVSRGGTRYRVLFLGQDRVMMTLPTLRRIAELASVGVTIVGVRPLASPSLADDEAEFAQLVEQLWTLPNVLEGQNIESAMIAQGITPDLEINTGNAESDVMFVHRSLPNAEIYFVNNRLNHAQDVEARFRVVGKAPELWDAVSGTSRSLSYRVEGDVTVVPLEMAAEDAFFVVFREDTQAMTRAIAAPEHSTVAQIEGPWRVRLQDGRGAPAEITLDALEPLNEHANPGVRYFSGVASYSTQFDVTADAAGKGTLLLDLGQVADVAEVWVNGRNAGISWLAPDRLDIGALVQEGSNTLEVHVANRWINRLIGDRQPDVEPITFTAAPTYQPDASLRPSGLIGPVTIVTMN